MAVFLRECKLTNTFLSGLLLYLLQREQDKCRIGEHFFFSYQIFCLNVRCVIAPRLIATNDYISPNRITILSLLTRMSNFEN